MSKLPSYFQSEGTGSIAPVHADFEKFYRQELRFFTGSRIRAGGLATRYQEWASSRRAQSLGWKAIRRAMILIGHRHLRSNGAYFLDVAYASDVPAIEDNFPSAISLPSLTPLTTGGESIGLATRIDAVVAQLALIRGELCGSHHPLCSGNRREGTERAL